MPNGEFEGFEEFESDSDEYLSEAREKETTEEAFDNFEEKSVEDEFTTEFEELAEAVLYDNDAESENEYLGKLIAQAAKILPALKKSDKRLKSSASQQDIVIKNLASDVYKWGKRLQRTRSKRLIQTAPVVLRRVMRIIEKKPDIILKKKGRIGALLNRSTQKIAKGSAAR